MMSIALLNDCAGIPSQPISALYSPNPRAALKVPFRSDLPLAVAVPGLVPALVHVSM